MLDNAKKGFIVSGVTTVPEAALAKKVTGKNVVVAIDFDVTALQAVAAAGSGPPGRQSREAVSVEPMPFPRPAGSLPSKSLHDEGHREGGPLLCRTTSCRAP
jgi:hypothetical protein